jgi:hypothetical protein
LAHRRGDFLDEVIFAPESSYVILFAAPRFQSATFGLPPDGQRRDLGSRALANYFAVLKADRCRRVIDGLILGFHRRVCPEVSVAKQLYHQWISGSSSLLRDLGPQRRDYVIDQFRQLSGHDREVDIERLGGIHLASIGAVLGHF